MRTYAVRLVAALGLVVAGLVSPTAAHASCAAIAAPVLPDAQPWWSSPVGMVTIALTGLVVVAVGGLGLAVLIGLVVGRRRRERAAEPAQRQPDSTGTPFE